MGLMPAMHKVGGNRMLWPSLFLPPCQGTTYQRGSLDSSSLPGGVAKCTLEEDIAQTGEKVEQGRAYCRHPCLVSASLLQTSSSLLMLPIQPLPWARPGSPPPGPLLRRKMETLDFQKSRGQGGEAQG